MITMSRSTRSARGPSRWSRLELAPALDADRVIRAEATSLSDVGSMPCDLGSLAADGDPLSDHGLVGAWGSAQTRLRPGNRALRPV